MTASARSRQEIQVGIVVILSVIVLVAGLLFLQNVRLRQSTQLVKVHFTNVGGLATGDPVHVRGIPLGKVSDIQLVDKGVLVRCQVDGRVKIHEDAVFHISSVGLVGERILALDPGTGAAIAPENHVFEGIYDFSMPELAGQMADLGDRFTEFLDRLEKTMDTLDEDDGLAATLREATRASRELATFFQSNQAQMQETTRNVASMTARMDDFLVAHSDSLGASLDRLPASMSRVDSLIARLDRVTEDSRILLAAINEQDGAVGKLIHDKELGAKVEDSILQVNALIADIRRNPQRYLHLTLMQF
ncbi:MAG TPA: MlaD family protein [Candidatus Krumholzibacteria bacterium]|nr:MlaD family protein [Candidatus Krumholzibacteria bacterium]